MSTIKETYDFFTSKLQPIYDAREAHSITRIVFEDEFSIHALNSQRPFLEEHQNRLDEILERLLKHEPVQYILGEADFFGYKFKVDSNVLIPRQETEELVYWVKNTIQQDIYKIENDIFNFKKHPQNLKILDIGTGSGCIPISLKKLIPEIEIKGIDVSDGALEIAKQNAINLDVDVSFKKNDILNLHDQEHLDIFHIIISNPPYIPIEESKLMPKHVLEHEPELALFVKSDDALLFYKKIASFAFRHLIENGFLFFEINEFNSTDVVKYLEKLNFRDIILENDINGRPRMIRAISPTRESIRTYFQIS